MRCTAALLSNAYPAQANGRAQLLPAGEFAARDGRPGPGRTWKLSNAQGQALAAQINAIATRTPISIDYEHQTLLAASNGQPAPAAGWIEQVQWLPGEGLFAQVRWTARAQALITADEYRYISPVITFAEDGTVVGLHNAALVSVPAIVGMDAVSAALAALAPLSNSATSPANAQEHPRMDLVLLATLLGLANTATAQDITAAITALAARPAVPPQLVTALGLQANADEAAALSAVQRLRAPDTTTVATITALQTTVAALSGQIATDMVIRTVDEAQAAHKLLPAQRDWAIGLGMADMAQLKAYLASAPTIAGLGGQMQGGNRDGGTPGASDPATIARKAVAYQTAQLAAGCNVSTQQAVAAVMAADAAAKA